MYTRLYKNANLFAKKQKIPQLSHKIRKTSVPSNFSAKEKLNFEKMILADSVLPRQNVRAVRPHHHFTPCLKNEWFNRRMDRAAMSCFASKKSGDPSSQGSAGTRHTCILFACHGEMQWSRTRRAQQGARLAARRRRPLFFVRCLCFFLLNFWDETWIFEFAR